DQIISMYDTEADKAVSLDELKPFLSRGLSRNNPLQISDIGVAPNADTASSPWGSLDRDDNYSLDAEERSKLESSLERYDYNGDAIVSLLELNENRTMQTAGDGMSSMRSMLDTTTLLLPVNTDSEDVSERKSARRSFSRRLMERYTFSIDIPRDSWSSWSDERWAMLDSNEDEVLDREELEQAIDLPADNVLYLSFPGLSSQSDMEFKLHCQSVHSEAGSWSTTVSGGKIGAAHFTCNLEVQDAYTKNSRELLRTRLEAALKDTQLQTIFTSQLQLQDGAFGLIDPNDDKKLDEDEFQRVWNWLSSRQGARLIVRWMLSERPWFHILDENGDQRLTEVELSQASTRLISLDRNQNGELTPDEMPLVVRMELDRGDNRLELNQILGMTNQASAAVEEQDWFSAMDANSDGYLAKEEYFGDADQFSVADADQDGFLSRNEVYEP
ncbi:MAG: hypothetical protein AAF483_11105, partial [Planctomycetota bacterium]